MARHSIRLSMPDQVLLADDRPILAQEQDDRSTPAEVKVLAKVQGALKHPASVKAARGLSHFGEHSAGWFAAGLLGAALDKSRRREWLIASAGVVGAHA